MKLLIYGLNFWPELTGVGKYSGEMAQWLVERGHAVDVVSAPPYYPAWQVAPGYSSMRYQREAWGTGGQVRITRCPLWVPHRVSTVRRLLHLATFALSSAPALWQALRARPDVVMVVVPTLFVAPLALALARLFQVPAWLHVQDFELDAMFSLTLDDATSGARPEGAVRRALKRAALALESRVIRGFERASSITPPMVDRLVAKAAAREHCMLFPNWVDLSAVFPLAGPNAFRAELHLAEDEVLVLYAGNMGEKQGLDIVIDAARALATKPGIRFVLAGSGAAQERLMQASAGLANVQWLPLQPAQRLNEMLNAADIHVLPQRADAADLVMPSKLTGMLASGRATVGTAAANTQLGQVLDEAGRRVEPGDVEGLVNALWALATDAPSRRTLGERARIYAEQHLGQGPIMERFEQQLLRLVRQPVSASRSSR